MSEIDGKIENEEGDGEEIEDEGIDNEKWEAAVELGRLASEETGMSGGELAAFIWDTYQGLIGSV